jgi:ubiquitin-conjugating enzyme E2 J2
LFPEYVDKYNQQQLSERLVVEQMSRGQSQGENSTPMLERVVNSVGEDMKRIDAVKDRRKDRKQSLPTWMMFVLVSIFGIVMALPLLQL